MFHATSRFAVGITICLTTCVFAMADGHDANSVPSGSRPCTMLREFPVDKAAYAPEAAKLVELGIPEKYGHEEWAAVVLSHELHQHVGIYTLIGAKMAVFARETLQAPMRAVHATVETGKQQPHSCMVDGIQVGLASTLGQNLIDVPETSHPKLAATFKYKERTIRVSLKPEYEEKIRAIIKDSVQKHGNLTPEYFQAVEQASFGVWANFDRTEVFEVEEK